MVDAPAAYPPYIGTETITDCRRVDKRSASTNRL